MAGNDAGAAEDDFHDAGTSTQTNTLVGGTLANVFAALTTIDPGVVGGPTFQAGALADNGGPVQTVAILEGGDADGTGSNAALPQDPQDLDGDGNTTEALPFDARGGQRVVGANVDVGAFEAGQFIVTTLEDEDRRRPPISPPSWPTATACRCARRWRSPTPTRPLATPSRSMRRSPVARCS